MCNGVCSSYKQSELQSIVLKKAGLWLEEMPTDMQSMQAEHAVIGQSSSCLCA